MKASLKIVLKKTQLSDGTYPINLRITIDRKSKFYKTPYSVIPKLWNEKLGEFTSKLNWDDINSNRFSYIRNKTGVAINVKIPDNKDLDAILNYFRIYRPFDTDYIFSILDKDINQYTKEELRARKSSVRDYYNKQLDLIA